MWLIALHGVVVKANGESVKVNVGEDENDPQFCVTDLLPHLAQNQMKQTMSEGIQGEQLTWHATGSIHVFIILCNVIVIKFYSFIL